MLVNKLELSLEKNVIRDFIPFVKLRGDCPRENEKFEFGGHRDWMV